MDVFSFYKRIISRRDAYALKEVRGYSRQNYKLTKRILNSSLEYMGFVIGTYNINPDNNTTRNPLIDIDNHSGDVDVKKDASLIYNWLSDHNMYPYIEGSGGDIKYGAHVGLICQQTRAIDVRDFLTQCLNELNLQHHEIYPKQDFVSADSYGSLTKLPFQYNNRTNQRSMIINPESYEPFNREEALLYLSQLPDSIIPVSDRQLTEVINVNNKEPEIINANLKIFLKMCRPCIQDIYYNRIQLSGHEGNDFRVVTAIELINFGASDETITDYFRYQTDFSEHITLKYIKYLREKNYKNTLCSTILRKCSNILNYKCNICDYDR